MALKRTVLRGVSMMLAASALITAGCNFGGDNQMNQGQGADYQQRGVDRMNENRGGMTARNIDEQIDVAEDAADQIANLEGVRSAYVLVTNNNAYVATVLDGQTPLTDQLENRIAQQCRQENPALRNVYVSTNPDFVDRVNEYVRSVQGGRPVTGFFDQFNEMIQRISPDAR